MHHGDFVKIKNFARIVEILDRKSRLFENAEYYYLHNAPRIVEIIVLHCGKQGPRSLHGWFPFVTKIWFTSTNFEFSSETTKAKML